MKAKKLEDLKYVTFQKGEVLFKEGEPGKNFFIIQKGKVEISVTNDGERTVVASAEAGDSIGEFAFITKKNRTATATASETVTVAEVSAETYQKMLDEIPFWAQNMIQELVKKLVSSTDLIKQHQSKNKELISALDMILE